MAKTVKTEPVTQDRIVSEVITCELCGEDSGRSGSWAPGCYDNLDVSVSLEEGCSFPEGGDCHEQILDICPDCFKNKLVPWFISQGGTVREEERDW